LYQEAFTFKPQFKPWMYGNHKPKSGARRCDLVAGAASTLRGEFQSREDLDLADKLERNSPESSTGRSRVVSIGNATACNPPPRCRPPPKPIGKNGRVRPFIRECCVIDRLVEVRANDLWNAYKAWCAENGSGSKASISLAAI